MTDGAIIMSKISKTFILTFSTQFQRGRFVSETRARMDKLSPAHEYVVEGNWREPLPIHTYERFEAFKLKKGRYQVVLMALVSKRKVYVLRCKDIPDYEAGCAIPSGVRGLHAIRALKFINVLYTCSHAGSGRGGVFRHGWTNAV